MPLEMRPDFYHPSSRAIRAIERIIRSIDIPELPADSRWLDETIERLNRPEYFEGVDPMPDPLQRGFLRLAREVETAGLSNPEREMWSLSPAERAAWYASRDAARKAVVYWTGVRKSAGSLSAALREVRQRQREEQEEGEEEEEEEEEGQPPRQRQRVSARMGAPRTHVHIAPSP